MYTGSVSPPPVLRQSFLPPRSPVPFLMQKPAGLVGSEEGQLSSDRSTRSVR